MLRNQSTNQGLCCLAAALLLTVFQLGCGSGSTQDTTDTSTPPPVATPAPTPTASTGNDTAAPNTWASVNEMVSFCDAPFCAGAEGFLVNADGSYQIGDGERSGQITASELTQLDAAATKVAAQNLGPGPVCTRRVQLPGASNYVTEMTFANGATVTIIDQHPGNSCFNGDPAIDGALHNVMHTLELKYDTRRPPGPSGGSGH